jgi:hypothetical protein
MSGNAVTFLVPHEGLVDQMQQIYLKSISLWNIRLGNGVQGTRPTVDELVLISRQTEFLQASNTPDLTTPGGHQWGLFKENKIFP